MINWEYTAFTSRRIIIVTLIPEDDLLAQFGKTVRKATRNEELAVFLCT